jgi:hypothetical protein
MVRISGMIYRMGGVMGVLFAGLTETSEKEVEFET